MASKAQLKALLDIITSTGRKAVPAAEDVIVRNVEEALPEMKRLADEYGGFSFNPRTGEFLQGGTDAGYMMATVPEMAGNRALPEEVINLIRDPYYMERLRRGQYLGGWMSGPQFVLDPSQRFVNKNRSIIRGGRAAQEAGFDVLGADQYNLTPELIAAAKKEAARRALIAATGAGAAGSAGLLGMQE